MTDLWYKLKNLLYVLFLPLIAIKFLVSLAIGFVEIIKEIARSIKIRI